MATNQTPEDSSNDYHYLSKTESIIALVLIYTLDVPIIVGNTLVVMAFLRDKQLQVTRNYYIFNLAVADLIIGVFVVPFYSSTVITGTWPLGWPFCVIWNITHNVMLLISHITIVFITYDRYILVRDALHYSATEIPKRAVFRIITAWVSVVIVKLVLIIWGEWYFSREGSEPSCSPRSRVEVPYIIGLWLYDVIFTAICVCFEVIIPLILIAVLNIKVYLMIRERRRKHSAVGNLIQHSLPGFHVMANISLTTTVDNGKNSSKDNRPAWRKLSPFLLLAKLSRKNKVSDTPEDTQKDRQSIVENENAAVDHPGEVNEVVAKPSANSQAESQGSISCRPRVVRRCSISLVTNTLINVAPIVDNDSISSVSSTINLDELPEAKELGAVPEEDNEEGNEKGNEGVAADPTPDPYPLLRPRTPSVIAPATLRPDATYTADNINLKPAKRVYFKEVVAEQMKIRSARNSVILVKKVKKKQDQKATITMSLFIACFIFFKLPFGIILMVYAVCRTDCIDDNLYEAFTWLYYAKSLVNPFLYAFICKRFRVYCVNMMSKVPGLSRCFKPRK